MKKIFYFLMLIVLNSSISFAITENLNTLSDDVVKKYEKVSKNENIIRAVEKLKGTTGNYSRDAILGKNLTNRPIKIEFTNLATINPIYTNFDALGWKKKKDLYIYINEKHTDAPIEALSALLAHEAIHQDEYNSLNEETYAWTLEAAVWTQLTDENPELEKISHPLIERENVIKQLFVRGNYTSEYIHRFVITNKGYQNLPERSYGFEELL